MHENNANISISDTPIAVFWNKWLTGKGVTVIHNGAWHNTHTMGITLFVSYIIYLVSLDQQTKYVCIKTSQIYSSNYNWYGMKYILTILLYHKMIKLQVIILYTYWKNEEVCIAESPLLAQSNYSHHTRLETNELVQTCTLPAGTHLIFASGPRSHNTYSCTPSHSSVQVTFVIIGQDF